MHKNIKLDTNLDYINKLTIKNFLRAEEYFNNLISNIGKTKIKNQQ